MPNLYVYLIKRHLITVKAYVMKAILIHKNISSQTLRRTYEIWNNSKYVTNLVH